MANICNENQISIIPAWIVTAITEVLEKAVFGDISAFFLCCYTVYIKFSDITHLFVALFPSEGKGHGDDDDDDKALL